MEWWGKMTKPMRNVLTKLGHRKSGQKKFRQDVRRCEYEDVQILWDMLKRKDPDLSGTKKKKPCWECVEWEKCGQFLCRGV